MPPKVPEWDEERIARNNLKADADAREAKEAMERAKKRIRNESIQKKLMHRLGLLEGHRAHLADKSYFDSMSHKMASDLRNALGAVIDIITKEVQGLMTELYETSR